MDVSTYSQAAVDALAAAMQQDASVVAMGEDIGRGGIFGQYRGLLERFGASRVIGNLINDAIVADSHPLSLADGVSTDG